jgi:acetyl-CoA carboxylase biotin carboxylase subunit
MRRALGEYVVGGIRTTVPFFTWLLAQPDFEAGRFHTTYLDGLLKARNGTPFVQPSDEEQETAAIAAALDRALSALGAAPDNRTGGLVPAAANGRWKTQARVEGLR